MNWRERATFRYLMYGVLFGMLFPSTATLFDIAQRGLPFGFMSVLHVQATQPLHWMINTAPLFLGFFASLAGRRQDKLGILNTMLTKHNKALKQAIEHNALLHDQTRRQLDELQLLHKQLLEADQTLEQLSAPLIPVDKGVIILPLVGVFDEKRVAGLEEKLLHGIQARRAQAVILDCTGIEHISACATKT
ncbi:MAG: STAS domain-containing protein [Chloroflexaceae bacterium]|nr:STAS domain-containing protein [Chloroflexaceae bacterium]NJO05410.1 STAS domain-containing protein [Chloroflexaceae bacterium]